MKARVLAALMISSVLVACAATLQPPARAPERARARAYPATLSPLPDGEIDRRARLLEGETPGWTIVLDSYGMLSNATCELCGRPESMDVSLSARDREEVAAFVATHDEILALDAPHVVMRHDTSAGVLYEQVTAAGSVGTISIDRFAGPLQIHGHAWPALPDPAGWLAEDAITRRLRAMDPREGLSLHHSYVKARAAEGMPTELHEAVCMRTDDRVAFSSSRRQRTAPAQPPCVDARTGERLEPLCEQVNTPSPTKTEHILARCGPG